jgi:hypothetical protein
MATLDDLQAKLEIGPDRIICVGDGSWDIHAILHTNRRAGDCRRLYSRLRLGYLVASPHGWAVPGPRVGRPRRASALGAARRSTPKAHSEKIGGYRSRRKQIWQKASR